jgi:hypothetical protein
MWTSAGPSKTSASESTTLIILRMTILALSMAAAGFLAVSMASVNTSSEASNKKLVLRGLAKPIGGLDSGGAFCFVNTSPLHSERLFFPLFGARDPLEFLSPLKGHPSGKTLKSGNCGLPNAL